MKKRAIKRFFQNFLLVFCSTIIVLLVCEIGASSYYYIKHHTFKKLSLIHEREDLIAKDFGPIINGSPSRGFENSIVLHPLFGFVYNPEMQGINNYGFLNEYDFELDENGYFLKDVDRSRSIVVGIFGGSFAYLTAKEANEYLCTKLKHAFPEYDPIVVNFGVGGHALPQSAFIFLYFRNMVDIAVFIDGLNELVYYVMNNNMNEPPEYAAAMHYNYKLSLQSLTPERFDKTAHILSLRKRIAMITHLSLYPVLRQLMITHYFWSRFTKQWETEIAVDTWDIQKSFEKSGRFFNMNDDETLTITAKQWGRYHQLIHDVSASAGIFDIHILQPNIFVPDSKQKITHFEQNIMKTAPALVSSGVTNGYSRIRNELNILSKNGIMTRDLSYIYKQKSDTIWADYAHANTEGYKLVVDELAKIFEAHSAEILYHKKNR